MAEIFYSSWKTQASEAGYTYQWRLGFQYTITQQVAANTSKIKREIYLYHQSSNTTYSTPFPSSFTISGGGTKNFTTAISFRGNSSAKIYSDEVTIQHSQDGTHANVTLSISYAGNSQQSSNSASRSVALPKINRYPVLTSAPNFNDEQNPTIKYSTTLGMTGASVKACIAVDGSTKVPYRDVVVEDGQYTFELTESERNTLRKLATTNTLQVEFTLRTTYNGTNYFSVLERTMTIVNGNPVLSTTLQETNANVISLLGSDSADKVIKYVSQVEVDVTATIPKQGASISGVTINGLPAVLSGGAYKALLNNLQSADFSIAATDTRENTGTDIVQKTLLDYQITKINTWSVKRASQTSSDLVLNADITCFSGTIDGNTNTPLVQYSLDNSTWTTIPASSYTISGDNITITQLTLSNLIPYQQNGKFYLKVSDLLTTSAETRDIAVGIYTFAKGDRKVRINGTLEIADSNGQNRVNVMNYIDSKNTYSTSEIKIGTWMDKPLYRKVVEYTNSSTIGQVGQETVIDIPHNISNLGIVWLEKGFTSDGRDIPFFNGTTTLSNGVCVPVINNTNIRLRIVNNTWGTRTWYFILHYTKTTD